MENIKAIKSIIPIGIFLIILYLFVHNCFKPIKNNSEYAYTHIETPQTDYTSRYVNTWSREINRDIIKTLIAHNITGCGELKYKESLKDRGEYLVHCSADGENWSEYIVWVRTGKILGPYKPSE
jgi:hypothetical protein